MADSLELRAPDPTLTAHLAKGDERPVTPYVQRTIITQPGRVPVAHRIVDHENRGGFDVTYIASCGMIGTRSVPTEDARWFAVSCGHCWPESADRSDETYLAWQGDDRD